MRIIHSLLSLFGLANKHYNKAEHHPAKESTSHDVVLERLWECMRPTRPRRDSPDCPFQLWVQDFPYHLCRAQHDAAVACPNDVHKCETRAKELAKHDGCPYKDELWGCNISPGKSCNGCYNNKYNCI